jgi:U4/U6 small nuclear ribonucleoprotein PRP3
MASINKRPAPVSIAEQIAEAKRRAEEMKAKVAALRNGSNGARNGIANGSASASTADQARPKKPDLEAIKARVAAATAKAQGLQPPQRPPASSTTAPSAFTDRPNEMNMGRGGLSIGIHPALLGDFKDRSKPLKKKKEEPKERLNPYLSEVGQGGRARRALHFNHNMNSRPAMEAANNMRRQAKLEEMKRQIQLRKSKAGLEDTTDISAYVIPAPPEFEWWDEDLQSGIENNPNITALVLHPIPIEAAQEKYIAIKAKPLMLTKKEQKKMRRLRRQKENKEQQAMVRLGMVPVPEPKITHSNVMKVYGELAVKDPTRVEQMVNAQVTERKEKHEEDNSSRQLTDEQRREKIKRKARENAAMGLTMSVFKIDLPNEKLLGKHRYKIDINAKQANDLTGLCLVAPSFAICIVEAGEHSTRKYQKLMIDRMQWKAILDGNGEINLEVERDEDDKDTTCTMLWQGQVRDRKFKKWGSIREAETDTQAKEVLKKAKMENFWTLAKSTTTVS